jgi:phage-related protein
MAGQTYSIGTAEGIIRITYDPKGVGLAKKDQEALGATSLKTGSAMSKNAKVMAAGGLIIAAGLGIAAKQAADFQQKMNLLVTAGGESKAALGLVAKGIESLAIETGTSLGQLADGMYIVEKAGHRGADGLNILRAAAQGARAEGTDLATMTTGLTSIMQSYAATMKDPIVATNELVVASGMAKTTMQEFVNSLPNVLPLASAVGISFAQVGAALATLTQHGTSAAEASQELNNTIRALVAPNQVAQKAMQQLGIDVVDLETNIGKRGLTGSIALVVDAIGKHMGPAGTVVVDVFKKSQSAGEDLKIMLNKMPPDLKRLSQQFLDGTLSAKDYRKGFRDLGATGNAMGGQFMSLATTASGFNDLLKSGQPAAQAFAGYLKQVMGGATGMNTALQLSGESAGYFNDAVDAINKSAGESGKDIATWATTQKNATVQLGRLKAAGEVLGVQLGNVLLPILVKIAKALAGMISWFAGLSDGWQKTIVGVLAVVASLLLLASTFKKLQEAAKALQALALFLKLDLIYTKLIAAATKAWAVVQAILDAEMWGSPIGVIILAVIALVAAIILVIKYHKQIGHFFVFIWGKIWSFLKMIGAWFAGPFVDFFKSVAKHIVDFFKPVVDFFKAIGSWFAGPFADFFVGLWHDLQKIWNGIVAVFKFVFDLLMAPVKAFLVFWQKVWGFFAPLVKAVWGLILAIIQFVLKLVWSFISFYLMLIIKAWNFAWDTIKAVWKVTWDFVKNVLSAVWNWIWARIQQGIALIVGAWNAFTGMLKAVWNAVWGWIKGVVMAFWNWIKPYVMAAVNALKAVISGAWNAVKNVTTSVWNTIIGFLKGIWNKIKSALSAIGKLGSTVGGWFQKAYDAAKSKITDLINWCKGIGKRILDAIGDLGKLLWDSGKKIITGLIDGITSMVHKLTDKLKSITNLIPSWKGPIVVDAKLLTPNGKAILAGLMAGIDAAVPALHKQLQGLTASIPLNVATGATNNTAATTMIAKSASDAAGRRDFGPYLMMLDDKVLHEFVIDTVTGEPKVIDKTSGEGARQNSWAGSGRKGAQ